MFSVGVGPSSSHTVGPMRAACSFVSSLKKSGSLANVAHVSVTLYGSLSLTGLGHGTDRACVAGLEGNLPDNVDTDHMLTIRQECKKTGTLTLAG
ncbi:L-serine ammonia-lyase, partial [Bifidobacteriaceae bacterium NR019]